MLWFLVRVLDLFAGLRGWSQPWADRGHETFCVELEPKFPADHRDVFDFDPDKLPWHPDVVLASPPCTAFSVMRIGRNWNHDHTPKNDTARHGLRLLERTLEIIRQIDPAFFVIENPMGKMRRMPQLARLEHRHVTYCQYGERRMKPTDLWGGFPPSLVLAPPCRQGAPCHEAAPRGSRKGTQALISSDRAMSAKIPHALSLAVCLAAEADFQAGLRAGRTGLAPVPDTVAGDQGNGEATPPAKLVQLGLFDDFRA
jgi:hypothetical protein